MTSQYSEHKSGALLWRHGLYTMAYTLLDDLFSGTGLLVNLNLHQILYKMICNMAIFGKNISLHHRPTY